MSTATTTAFQPLNDIERLLIAVHSGGAAARDAFETALMDAPLHAAAPAGQADGPTVTLLSHDDGGQRGTALFTAPERIAAAFGGEVDVVTYPGRAMIEMVQGRPAVLNPGSGYGARWSADALPALLGRPVPSEAARTPVRLITPMDAPADLISALRQAFGAAPAVEAAWLALADMPDGSRALHLDVRGDPNAIPVPLLLREAMSKVPPLALPLDVRVTPPSDQAGIGVPIVARG